MMIRIIAKRLSGGTSNKHIVGVKWISNDDNTIGENSTQEIVDWLNKGGTRFCILSSYAADRE